MTELLREAIANNVTEIINYDPRVQVEQVTVDTYESGIMIECTLLYLPYNISESMRMRFDEDNSILT
jgi:phage baseplate assembly protein W